MFRQAQHDSNCDLSFWVSGFWKNSLYRRIRQIIRTIVIQACFDTSRWMIIGTTQHDSIYKEKEICHSALRWSNKWFVTLLCPDRAKRASGSLSFRSSPGSFGMFQRIRQIWSGRSTSTFRYVPNLVLLNRDYSMWQHILRLPHSSCPYQISTICRNSKKDFFSKSKAKMPSSSRKERFHSNFIQGAHTSKISSIICVW